jgi:Secretion system C-terminal sorting domain
MIKTAGLYFAFVMLSLEIFSTITIPKSVRHHISESDATDFDYLYSQRQLLMLADPATGKIPDDIRALELAFYNHQFGNDAHTRADVWQSVGPWNVGGRTRAIAFDVTNENIILAAGVSGGIWRTTDGGANWNRVSDTSGYLGIISIAQDTRVGKQNIWYAQSGELSGNSASAGGAYYLGDGAFKSIDSGKTWTPLAVTATGVPASSIGNNFQVAWRIATHPRTDVDEVLVATYGNIYRSIDGGATFTAVLAAGSAYYTDVAVTSNGIIYATISNDGSQKGFFKSIDSGATFINITPTQFITAYDRTVMGINPNNENEVYFFTYLLDSTNAGGTLTSNYKGSKEYIALLKYNDTATNKWIDLSSNLPNNSNMISSGTFDKLNCQGGYDMFVKVQPVTGAVFIGGTNIFRSTDAFTTPNNFVQIGGYKPGTALPKFEIYPNHHPDCHDLLFYPSNYKKLLSASDGGVRMTMDGNSASPVVWTTLNNGYITSQPYTVTLDPTWHSRYLLAGFQDNGNFITPNYLNTNYVWTMPFNGDGAYNYIAQDRKFYVMSIQEGKVVKFDLDANGAVLNWTRIDPIGPKKEDYTFINPFAVDPNDNNLLYLPAGHRLYRQSQLSTLPLINNWDTISTGWYKFADTTLADITAIAISQKPANIVYIGTANKNIYRIENANSATPIWKNVTKSILPSGFVSCIAIDPDNAYNFSVVYSNYSMQSIFNSADSGITYKYCGGNLEKTTNFSGAAPSIRWLEILKTPTGGRKYFLGTSIGLYSTDSLRPGTGPTKDSTIWVQENKSGIATSVVNYITHRQNDFTVAVSTHGNGLYVGQYFSDLKNSNFTTTPVAKIYPNPCTDKLYLDVQVPLSSKVAVSVYNINGALVQYFETNNVLQGQQQIFINTTNIKAGMYIVNANAGKQVLFNGKVQVVN